MNELTLDKKFVKYKDMWSCMSESQEEIVGNSNWWLNEDDVKKAIKVFKEKLRGCPEFFNVKDYQDIVSTDKFMGIVEIFLRDIFGEKLTKNDALSKEEVVEE